MHVTICLKSARKFYKKIGNWENFVFHIVEIPFKQWKDCISSHSLSVIVPYCKAPTMCKMSSSNCDIFLLEEDEVDVGLSLAMWLWWSRSIIYVVWQNGMLSSSWM